MPGRLMAGGSTKGFFHMGGGGWDGRVAQGVIATPPPSIAGLHTPTSWTICCPVAACRAKEPVRLRRCGAARDGHRDARKYKLHLPTHCSTGSSNKWTVSLARDATPDAYIREKKRDNGWEKHLLITADTIHTTNSTLLLHKFVHSPPCAPPYKAHVHTQAVAIIQPDNQGHFHEKERRACGVRARRPRASAAPCGSPAERERLEITSDDGREEGNPGECPLLHN